LRLKQTAHFITAFMETGLDSGLYTARLISEGTNGFINVACFLAKTRATL